jgi:hypothetical protein
MTKNEPDESTSTNQPSWFERNVNLLIGLLVASCVAVLVAELVFRPFFDDHHPAHFEIENIFGYQAAIGFVAFITVVFLGKFLRLIVRRGEDYYDS